MRRMHQNKKARLWRLGTVLCLVSAWYVSGSRGISAAPVIDPAFSSYTYNAYGQAVSAPAGYVPDRVLSGGSLEAGSLGQAQDMASTADGSIYVLLKNQGQLLELDEELGVRRIVALVENGEPVDISGASGLCVTGEGEERRIYLADTEHQRVLIADRTGVVLSALTKPEDPIYPQSSDFRPSKVTVGSDGTIYVLCQNVYKGAAIFSRQQEFLGFYGSNAIDVTPALLLDYFWKSLMNPEQLAQIKKTVPIEYTNFDMDEDGFLYTVTATTDNSTNEIKRLNSKSANIFPQKDYGDLDVTWINTQLVDTAFVDVEALDGGIVTALDATRGRLFMYDQDGRLLMAFGDTGSFTYTFRSPCAVTAIGDYLYVLDPYKDTVTRLVPTEYGSAILRASRLYQNGRYEESMGIWDQVLRQNGNYELAYIGIAKGMMATDRYEEAMSYYRQGQDHEGYSQALGEYRKGIIRVAVGPVLLAVTVMVILVLVYRYFFHVRREVDMREAVLGRQILYTMVHPSEGFQLLTREGRRGSSVAALLGVMGVFVASVVQRQWTGFTFNENQPEKLNIWLMFLVTAGLFLLFVVSNRLVCTLFNGNGTWREIFIVTAISLLPGTGAVLLRTLVSNICTLEDAVLLHLILAAGVLWSLILLLAGMGLIHEYSFKQAFLAFCMTVAGILIMLFIGLLVWGLYNQIIAFFSTIMEEIGSI